MSERSEQLRRLDADVGDWDAEIEVYAGPAPSTSRGLMKNRLACGGMWLVADYVTTEPASGFAGHGMWTWDAQRQRYVGVWADNMMTFLAPGEGTWDQPSRTMTYLYQATVGGKELRWRQTTEHVDDDTRVFLSFVPDTADRPMMKATYRRKKA